MSKRVRRRRSLNSREKGNWRLSCHTQSRKRRKSGASCFGRAWEEAERAQRRWNG